MKKLMTLALVVVFVATAFAAMAAETTFEGTYRVRAWSEWNFDKQFKDVGGVPTHEDAQYDGWFDQRFRLTITHTRSEYLKAVIRMDIVEDTWGQRRALRMNNSATDFGIWAYLEFTIPKIGTFTAGKFPETYGYGLAFSDGGTGTIGLTGARWANAWGPVAVSVLYAKVADRVTAGTGTTYNWDANLFAANVKITPVESHVIELFGGYLVDNDASGASGVGGTMGNSFAALVNGVGDYNTSIGFAGIAYTGTVADMIDIGFEYSWIFGSADRHYGPGLAAPGVGAGAFPASGSIEGWNLYADVSYYNDLLRVGVAFIMGSGQHHYWNAASYDNVNMNYISQDDFAFNKILANGGGGTNSVYSIGNWASWNQDNIENLTAVKLYFEICPVEKLTLTASVTWAKWTEEVGTNASGSARGLYVTSKGSAYPHPAAVYGNYAYNAWNASTDLGWEINLGASYEIMEGLTYSFDAGVLFTGDSWQYEKADGTRGDWGEIWSFTNAITYTF